MRITITGTRDVPEAAGRCETLFERYLAPYATEGHSFLGVALLQGLPELGSRQFGASGDDRLQACGMRGSDGAPRSAT